MATKLKRLSLMRTNLLNFKYSQRILITSKRRFTPRDPENYYDRARSQREEEMIKNATQRIKDTQSRRDMIAEEIEECQDKKSRPEQR